MSSSLHEVRGRCEGNDNTGRWLSCKETVSHERERVSQHEEGDRHSVFDAGIMLPRTRPGLHLGILQKGRKRRRGGERRRH